jgi:hypothetical protein
MVMVLYHLHSFLVQVIYKLISGKPKIGGINQFHINQNGKLTNPQNKDIPPNTINVAKIHADSVIKNLLTWNSFV